MSTSPADTPAVRVPTQQLIRSMLHGRDRVSDLIFSPGRAPQVEERGELIELPFEGLESLTPAQTIQIAEDLIGANQIATQQLTKSGSADLSYIEAAAGEIGPVLRPGAVVVNKSTVPVGSTRVVESVLQRSDVAVVSNPEFLREGTAVHDFLHPDRVARRRVDALLTQAWRNRCKRNRSTCS